MVGRPDPRSPVDTVYLDNAATTPVDEAVLAAVAPFLAGEFGNPSSRHPLGVRAAEALDRARAAVARAVGARPQNVTFTSGGTEANNLAVLGAARARRREGANVVIGPTEHPSVRASAAALEREGFEVRTAPLDRGGGLDLEGWAALVDGSTVVAAQMLVNNEFGALYPVPEVARLVRRAAPEAHLHVDAVQGLGKVPLDLEELGADSIALSAHKVHAPKGTGAIVAREGVRIEPLIHGGGQQGGLRPGTENVAGAVGFGEAARLAAGTLETTACATAAARAVLEEGVARIEGARVLEPAPQRVAAICAVLLPGAPAEVWLHHLEARGVMVSAGSACQARSREISPALLALGLNAERAKRVLRFSFSRHTRVEEVEHAVHALLALAPELEALS